MHCSPPYPGLHTRLFCSMQLMQSTNWSPCMLRSPRNSAISGIVSPNFLEWLFSVKSAGSHQISQTRSEPRPQRHGGFMRQPAFLLLCNDIPTLSLEAVSSAACATGSRFLGRPDPSFRRSGDKYRSARAGCYHRAASTY